MSRQNVLSLLFIVMFLLPMIPTTVSQGSPATLVCTPTASMERSDASSSQQLNSPSSSSSRPAPQAQYVVPPDVPEWTIGQGAPRGARLAWNLTETFLGRTAATDFQVHIDTGRLYSELNVFTRIGDISTKNASVAAEDWNPAGGYYWYWSLWTDEVALMAFNITGHSPCRLDSFAVFACSVPSVRTTGLLNYTVFAAEPNATAGHGTRPDTTARLAPWMQTVVDIPTNQAGWLSLPITLPFIIDASMTYANTFYFAVALGSALSGLNWVLMDDVGSPPQSDNGEDDGDAWYTLSWPSLTFISGPSIDFFVNVRFHRHPYPSELSMHVNGTAVKDFWPYPGVGYWQRSYGTGIPLTNVDRYFDVSYVLFLGTYDVTWLGWFYQDAPANSTFKVWTDRTTVDWNITLLADFPSKAINRAILVSVESDWNVTQVLRNGVPFSSWTRNDSLTSGSWVVVWNATDGSWLVQCEGYNYVAGMEIQDQWGSTVTQVYAADNVTVYGYVRNPFGVDAINGRGYMLVYAPNESLHYWRNTILIPPPAGIIMFNWPVWATVTTLGSYTLHLIWANGTQAGIMSMTLEVMVSPTILDIYEETPPPGEDVIKGQPLVFLFYYGNYGTFPPDRAEVTVVNNTDPLRGEWNGSKVINYRDQGAPGFYGVVLFTDNATVGFLHDITITFVQNCYEAQNYNRTFTIVTGTAYTAYIVLLQGQGLDNTTGVWRTAPEPLINESNTEFTFKLVTQAGIPIEGATIHAYLVKGSGEDEKSRRLDWEELTSEDSTTSPKGRYNVTVDVRPIENEVFHAGEEAFIIILAVHPRYQNAYSELIYVRPQPRPSMIDVPDDFHSIDLYEDWSYPTMNHPVILRVILRDALNGEDLSHGRVWAEIPGLGITNLTLATSGLGLYEIPSLATYALSPGTYNVTIRATARDFVQTLTTVTFDIHPKQGIVYSVGPGFPPTIPNQGMEWSLTILFQFEELATKMASLSAGQGAEPIPEGTKAELEIRTTGGSISVPPEYVGSDGKVTFHGILAQEGDYSFYITIALTESYTGLDHVLLEANGSTISVSCVSVASYFRSMLPSIALFAAVLILLPLGGFLTYRHVVSLPRRQRRLAKYQAIADTFSDVANLNRLLVLHKESGICIFDPFAEETRDATLVAGFLQAISTFGHDMVGGPGLAEKDKERASTLRELTYEGFRILIHDGQFVRNALVLSGKPSDQLRNRLERFTGEFEKRYHKEFDHWSGRVDQFNSASDLVEEIFLVSLRLPHRVRPRKPPRVSLTPLEDDLYKLARELTKDREYLFIGQILSTYLITAKRDKLEVLMALYQLRQKGLLMPWQLGDTTAPTETETAPEAEPENSG